MPILVSTALIKKLPQPEQADVPKVLWDKSGGKCFLCGRTIIESADRLVADHDIPEAEGGPTTLANLNLVHDACNSFKRSHPTVDVRPFLKLSALIKDKGGFARYDQAVGLLGIKLSAIDFVDKGGTVCVTGPDKISAEWPVFSETNKSGTFRFAFVRLTKDAIFNDDECQPRSIKLQHLWAIYNDICRNPLHEAPACRLVPMAGSVQSKKALLFDGQHKSLAFWLAGRQDVAVKIYIDISKNAAVRLVNSVQAKIKKLPLSPFELAGKMAEEWQERVSAYEASVGTASASEAGFIKWVEKDERARATSAFVDALYQSIIEKDDLQFTKIILKPGEKAVSAHAISETTFKNKVLRPLIHLEPLAEKFDESALLRSREAASMVRLLNIFYSRCFEPSNGVEMSPQEEARARRVSKQAALAYIASLMRALIGHRLVSERPRELLDKEPSAAVWTSIEADMGRIVAHPVWTADLSKSAKMTAIRDLLEKNQGAAAAFSNVGLKLGYVVGADKLDPNCLD